MRLVHRLGYVSCPPSLDAGEKPLGGVGLGPQRLGITRAQGAVQGFETAGQVLAYLAEKAPEDLDVTAHRLGEGDEIDVLREPAVFGHGSSSLGRAALCDAIPPVFRNQ